jgi:hypothetical protein
MRRLEMREQELAKNADLPVTIVTGPEGLR